MPDTSLVTCSSTYMHTYMLASRIHYTAPLHPYTRMSLKLNVRMYVCMYVRTYVCMYVCMYECMYVCAYALIRAPILCSKDSARLIAHRPAMPSSPLARARAQALDLHQPPLPLLPLPPPPPLLLHPAAAAAAAVPSVHSCVASCLRP